jgi:ribulose 1,5-bisphosphate synthetase/thiazole synthase
MQSAPLHEMQALQDRKVEDIGMKHFDVIVIGGGPSGLMAAIAAGEQGAGVC